ncbi:alpha amylase C-terminal domain-containing protein [Zooshikella ganghwensis]|nr:alpha amylase C-terminal domain-containing protein [Zooshikella ganghwensis]
MNTIVNVPSMSIHHLVDTIVHNDPWLAPYRSQLTHRLIAIEARRQQLCHTQQQDHAPNALIDIASGHEYFGLHFRNNQWQFHEWAPNASAIYLVGDMNQWQPSAEFQFQRIDGHGHWELLLPETALQHGQHYRLHMVWPGGEGPRIPAYARRVVQDSQTLIFSAQVWRPKSPYCWKNHFKRPNVTPLIYEAHVGMAQEEGKVGSYQEFTVNTLPRIKAAGYNTIQLMGIPEHPYYGSFGYHVSSYFAPASRFGSPEALMELIDTAHGMGISVLIDLVHSHAVANHVEGLGLYDGTSYQFFHEGPRGRHPAWDSCCFNYAKPEVLHFLLSNCRYWLDNFKVDGFRFDGITSMLYHDHGLGQAFTSYDHYFNHNVDLDALTYLALANQVIHNLRPDAITIAEDMSGMPGLALPTAQGGIGFDYRFAMGIPDLWIKYTKDIRDEDWSIVHLWHELINRRHDEKTISYTESHDQALVGDKTLIFRLADAAMYWHMNRDDEHLLIDRAIALHKMLRLVTLATAGHGYLNFMGNEFGHPEWIDFPREGNHWSYHHARRQWSLADNPNLKYCLLNNFDQAMLALCKTYDALRYSDVHLLWVRDDDKVLAFERHGLIWVFNFHANKSFTDYSIPAPAGEYEVILSSDDERFGGHNRLATDTPHVTLPVEDSTSEGHSQRLHLYLPTRTAIVLKNRQFWSTQKPG